MIKELKDRADLNAILMREFQVPLGIDPFMKCFFYWENDEISGMSYYSSLYDHADLNYIWVDDRYRQKKIGSKLLQRMIIELKKEKISKITLEVNETNEPAFAFYRCHGFEQKAIRSHYYKEDIGILMVLELGE